MPSYHQQRSKSPGEQPHICTYRLVCVIALVGIGILVLRSAIPGSIVHAQAGSVTWSEPVRLTAEGKVAGSLFYAPIQVTTDKYGYVHIFWREMSEPGAIMYARSNGLDPVEVRDIMATETAYPVSAFVDENDNLHLTIVEENRDFYLKTVPLSQSDNARAWIGSPTVAVPGAVYQSTAGTWYALRKTLGEGYISFSDDAGASWSDETLIVSAEKPGEYVQFDLVIDRNDRLHLAWTSVVLEGPGSGYGYFLNYAFSDDHGRTWSDPLTLDKKDERYWETYGITSVILTLDSLDRLHLIWFGAPAGQRHYRRSDDGGRNWTEDLQLWPEHRGITGPHKLAEDSAGVMHLVTGRMGGGLFHASLTQGNWSVPVEINPSIGDAESHQVVITAGNRLHAIWANVMETHDVWYASGFAAAPAIQVPAYPTPAPEPMARKQLTPAIPAATTPPTQVPGLRPPVVSDQESVAASPGAAILTGALASFLAVGVVVVVELIRKRQV